MTFGELLEYVETFYVNLECQRFMAEMAEDPEYPWHIGRAFHDGYVN